MIHKPILVVSPPRSGSSLFSNIINAAGVFGGNMKPADKWNVNGYFENLAITKLVVDYLRKCDTEGLGKRYNPIGLCEPYNGNLDIDCYKIILNEGYTGGKWFFKDPKLCWAWSMFDIAFPDALWVIVKRDMKQVIASIQRTAFMDAYTEEQSWIEYVCRAYENIFQILTSVENVISVDINKVLDGDQTEIAAISGYLGIPISNIHKIVKPHVWNTQK